VLYLIDDIVDIVCGFYPLQIAFNLLSLIICLVRGFNLDCSEQ
jgi:hypothetical protein